jgi:hypothetical protein
VVKSVKLDLFTFESIRYIRDHTDAIMPDSYIPMSLAAEGNLGGLQDLLKGGSVDTFPWKSVASIAAITGRLNILEWVHTLSAATPSSDSVETACKLGHHAVLVWIFDVAHTQIVPFSENGKISALGCILYAAMHNQREAMDWILKHPLANVLPRMEDAIRLQDENITYETQKVVLEWIASKSREDIESEPTVMLCAAQQGHLQSFRELYEKGQPVTAVIAERAAFYRRINILEAIYEIDPSLVCKWDIFDLVSIGDGRFWKNAALDWLRKKCLRKDDRV